MEISITFINHIQPNLNTFPKSGVIFASIRSRGRLVKRELRMLGMVQKKLYRNTLTGGEGGSIDHIRTYSRLKGFVQSHTSLFTKRNYLAFF